MQLAFCWDIYGWVKSLLIQLSLFNEVFRKLIFALSTHHMTKYQFCMMVDYHQICNTLHDLYKPMDWVWGIAKGILGKCCMCKPHLDRYKDFHLFFPNMYQHIDRQFFVFLTLPGDRRQSRKPLYPKAKLRWETYAKISNFSYIHSFSLGNYPWNINRRNWVDELNPHLIFRQS